MPTSIRASEVLGATLLAILASSAGFAADPVAVSQAELRARLKAADPTLLVLDVRAPTEFAAGHVPGAINIPHDQLEARLGELSAARERNIVTYCRTGRRSDIALATLRRRGFTRLGHLQGDFEGWEAAHQPVERATSASVPVVAPRSAPRAPAPPAS